MNEYNDTDYIYIVLVKALTGIGEFARKLTKYDYTHIAVSFDESLTDFISFSRRNHYVPLDSGIMHEYRSCYAYGDIEEFKAKVFKLPVPREKLKEIKKIIYDFENDKDYMFNLFSMITMPILQGFPVYKTHNCMSFTGFIIKETGCIEMNKPYYKYSIPELDKLLTEYLFFEGNLKKDDKVLKGYMIRPKFMNRAKISFKTIFKLLGRLIAEKKGK